MQQNRPNLAGETIKTTILQNDCLICHTTSPHVAKDGLK
jgi:hypothetical protein